MFQLIIPVSGHIKSPESLAPCVYMGVLYLDMNWNKTCLQSCSLPTAGQTLVCCVDRGQPLHCRPISPWPLLLLLLCSAHPTPIDTVFPTTHWRCNLGANHAHLNLDKELCHCRKVESGSTSSSCAPFMLLPALFTAQSSAREQTLPPVSFLLDYPAITKPVLCFLANSGRFDSLYSAPADPLSPFPCDPLSVLSAFCSLLTPSAKPILSLALLLLQLDFPNLESSVFLQASLRFSSMCFCITFSAPA